MPLRGNGWYSQPLIEYALANGLIDKTQIEYQLIPTNTLKAEYFVDIIEYFERVFGHDTKLLKAAINSFVGMLCTKETHDDYFTLPPVTLPSGRNIHRAIVTSNVAWLQYWSGNEGRVRRRS